MAKRKYHHAGNEGYKPRKRRQAKALRTDQSQTSKLLALPTELRNAIYELVLINPDVVVISPTNFEQPGLISTCKQVRAETMSIYREQNKFTIEVIDCLPQVPKASSGFWLHKCKVPHAIDFIGVPDWDNLKIWLKACYHGEWNSARSTEKELQEEEMGVLDDWRIVYKAFDFVAEMAADEKEWEEVARYFDLFKSGVRAAAADPSGGWA